MRLLASTALFLAIAAPLAAQAAPAAVQVRIDPKLEQLGATKYGTDEIVRLSQHLKTGVERALAKSGALDDARVELVLVDAQPNRPTFKELGAKPGLSYESFSVGGARIEGQILMPDGSVTPVSYSWYENDIRQSQYDWTWSDAEWTFNRFASRLARGQTLAAK